MSQGIEGFAARFEQAIANQAEQIRQAEDEAVTGRSTNGEVEVSVAAGKVMVSIQDGVLDIGREMAQDVIAEAIDGLLAHYTRAGAADDTEMTGLTDELEQQMNDLQAELAKGLANLKSRAESMPAFRESPTRR